MRFSTHSIVAAKQLCESTGQNAEVQIWTDGSASPNPGPRRSRVRGRPTRAGSQVLHACEQHWAKRPTTQRSYGPLEWRSSSLSQHFQVCRSMFSATAASLSVSFRRVTSALDIISWHMPLGIWFTQPAEPSAGTMSTLTSASR